VTTTDEPPQFFDQTVIQEASIAGTASNTFVETQANDANTQILMEQTSGGKPSKRYSYLEHKWMIPIRPGASLTLFANAWAPVSAEGDTFVFSYSTDDENYTDMFTVSADFDDDSYNTYPLPSNLSGTLYIKVKDTLRYPGRYDINTLYIDHLFIRTDNDPGSPPVAPSGLTATGVAFDSISLAWTDTGDSELGFLIERSAGTNSWEPVGTTGPDAESFTDTGLSPDTTYDYRVQAFNAAGSSAYTAIASAVTKEAEALHVAALESYVEVNRRRWNSLVTIAVHNQSDTPVDGATVVGLWENGNSGSGVTDETGKCTVSMTLKTSTESTSFRVTGIVKNGYVYDAASNVDNSIVVSTP
jgi:hypothetical protein